MSAVVMPLSHTKPAQYFYDIDGQRSTVERVSSFVYPIFETSAATRSVLLECALVSIKVNLEKAKNSPIFTFDIDDLSRDLLSAKEGFNRSFNAYRKLGKMLDVSDYVSVSKETVKSVEDTTIALDATIDELESIIENSRASINRFIMNLDLNRALTLQFILSNKVADYYIENNKIKYL